MPTYPACLESVLIKVSGDASLIGAPGVAKLANQASEFVSGFRYRDRSRVSRITTSRARVIGPMISL